jgi:hypothetical protein
MLKLGQESTVTVGGKQWRLGRFTLPSLRLFKEFVERAIGDPFEEAKLLKDFVSKEEFAAIMREAVSIKRQLAGFTLGCPIAQKYMADPEGLVIIGRGLLSEHHADATDAEVFAVMMAAAEEAGDVSKVIEKAQGILPNSKPAPGEGLAALLVS